MGWLHALLTDERSIATSLLVLALAIALGLAIGTLRFRGIQLGVTGVLFSGLLLGHLGLTLEPAALEFARESGLTLFVYAVGLAVGPGFFNALRAHGLRSNLFAVAVVLVGTLVAAGASALGGVSPAIAVGILSGAATNTPSLAAATQTLHYTPPDAAMAAIGLHQAGVSTVGMTAQQIVDEARSLPGLGYAVAYPFAVVGIITSMLLLRRLFGVDAAGDARELERRLVSRPVPLERCAARISNARVAGVSPATLPELAGSAAVVSRVQRDGRTMVALPGASLALGDVVIAVGTALDLERLCRFAGEAVDPSPFDASPDIAARWVLLSRPALVGQPLEEARIADRFRVQVTRVRRGETEIPPLADLRLAMGDLLHVVGAPEAVAALASEAGDAPKELEEPHLLPVFVGIGLGVVIGSIPFSVPGLASPVRIGLAGGALLVALAFARLQRWGPLVFYLPRAANMAIKDLGIAVFLAAVGLKSGGRFVATLTQGDGIWWMAWGAAITIVPLLVVGAVAHWLFDARYAAITGLIAGSMTDPPALAFANSLTRSEVPNIDYATVYPVAMILRVVCAQLFVLAWTG